MNNIITGKIAMLALVGVLQVSLHAGLSVVALLSKINLPFPGDRYRSMQLHHKTPSSCEYFAKETPDTLHNDDMPIKTKDKDEKMQKSTEKPLVIDPKRVIAATLSSNGTVAAVVGDGSGSKVVLRDVAGTMFKGYRLCRSTPAFAIACWNDHIITLGSSGWINYWDPHSDSLSCCDTEYCIPSAMVIHDKGKYAMISAMSLTRGQLFHFFHTTTADSSKSSKLMKWQLFQKKSDRLKQWVTALALHPSDPCFAIATADGKIQLWNIAIVLKENRAKEEWTLPGPCMKQHAYQKIVAMLQHDFCIVGASSRENIMWFDTRSCELAHYATSCHKDTISSLKYVGDKAYVSGSEDGTVKLWDVRNTKDPVQKMAHGFPVVAITLRDKGGFASCSKNAVVKNWNFRGEQIRD